MVVLFFFKKSDKKILEKKLNLDKYFFQLIKKAIETPRIMKKDRHLCIIFDVTLSYMPVRHWAVIAKIDVLRQI